MKLYIVELENGLISAVEKETLVQQFNCEKKDFYANIDMLLMHFHIDNIELIYLRNLSQLEGIFKKRGFSFRTTSI